MKHLQYFERTKVRYMPGDYIIFNKVITDVNSYKNYGIVKTGFAGKRRMYDVDYLDANDFKIKNIQEFLLYQDEIEGLMTPKQIEDFELKAAISKYNL